MQWYMTKYQKLLFDLNIDLQTKNKVALTIKSSNKERFDHFIANLSHQSLPGLKAKLEPDEYSNYPQISFSDNGERTLEFCTTDTEKVIVEYSPYLWNINSILKLVNFGMREETENTNVLLNAQESIYSAETAFQTNKSSHRPISAFSPKRYCEREQIQSNTITCHKEDILTTRMLSQFLKKTAISDGGFIEVFDVAGENDHVLGPTSYHVYRNREDFLTTPLCSFENVILNSIFSHEKFKNYIVTTKLVSSPSVEKIEILKDCSSPALSIYIRPLADETEITLSYNSTYISENESKEHYKALERYLDQQVTELRTFQSDLQFSLFARMKRSFQENLDEVAILTPSRSYSYRELGVYAEQVKSLLPEKSALVGICARPSIEFIATALACYSKKVPFLAIDPFWGETKIQDIIERSEIDIVFRDDSMVSLPSETASTQIPSLSSPDFIEISALAFEDNSHLDRIIYQIYTSGSTGQPKAVRVSERNLSALFSSYKTMKKDLYKKSWAFLSSVSFDASVKQYLGPLAFGGSIFIPQSSLTENPESVYQELSDFQVEVINLTPSVLRPLLKSNISFGNIDLFLGGETLKPALVKEIHQRFGSQISLTNLYGPTETTINATMYQIDFGIDYQILPIGKSLSHCSAEIINENKSKIEALPLGFTGELWILGDTVTDGLEDHLDNNRFTKLSNSRGYRTGDLCFEWFDKQFYFVGRNDSQVKVNGIRVDLNEISRKVFERFPEIETEIFFKTGKIYSAFKAHQPDVSEKVLNWLDERPFGYVSVIPVFLSQFPITKSGKIDKKK